MVFNSAIFLICFLPLFFLCYYLLPARFRNAFLLVGSLGFYAWGDPGNILLLLAASAATYGVGGAQGPAPPQVRPPRRSLRRPTGKRPAGRCGAARGGGLCLAGP